MILRRIIPLFLIIFVHISLLYLLLHFFNKVQITADDFAEIIPAAIIAEPTPIVAKEVKTPPSKTPSKKPRQIKKVHSPTTILQDLPTEQSSSATSTDGTFAQSMEPVTEAGPALLSLPPPSASYLLDVVRTEPKLKNPYYGSGKIRWHHDNRHYTMQIEVGIDVFFATVNLYNMQSEGTLGETGIKPIKATETRRTKTPAITQFNYDDKSISFSADPIIIPLVDGVQDKITVLMQLASLGNADPAQFQPGKEITIQVAEEKEAHLHQFVVVGQETISSKLGELVTWHIIRPPRSGVYSSRVDIWLAPELNWIPVQIRNTEANGAVTIQTIRQIIQE